MAICPALSGIDLDGKLVKQECIKHECSRYMNVIGADPQTGEQLNRWDCSDVWIPVLLIENSKQQRGTQAAIESFRNEMAKDNKAAIQLANDQLLVN